MFGLGFAVRWRGFRRFADGGVREVRRPLRLIAVSTAALLTVTLVPAEAFAGRSNPARTEVELPELQKDITVPGADSTATFQMPVAPGTQEEYAPTRITPIDGGTDHIVLNAGGTQGVAPNSATTVETSSTDMQQVASLPLWVGPAQTATPSGVQASVTTTAETTTASGTWTVTVPTRAETEAAGIDGVIMKLEPSPDATPVDLKLKYETFEQLYGAGWGSRLRFVRLPECFLTTPEVAGCSEAVEVPSANNGTTNEVTASVAAPDSPVATAQADSEAVTSATASTGGAMVLAAVGGESGEAGNYKATSLQPSGKWTAGGSSGGFAWSYPITTPPTAGLKPSVSLSYSSQSVDGRTSTTNNQASWVGDGWDYHPGFIERTYRSCVDDKTGSNTTKKTGDLCWGSENAVMSLNGSTVPLVKDDASGVWKPQRDDGTRVEQKFDTTNGDDNNEYWLVTTPDGTRYHFGLNRLPGWVPGNPTTESAWTVPVFGNQADEPCHQAIYENSACDQAWRWNLDYVEDTRGNAMAMYWKQEKNWYAKAGKTDQPKPYVRGGWLDRIEYGLRNDAVYTKPAAAKVSFTVDERCLRTPEFDCSDAKFTKHSEDGLHWPDVPVDSMCKETGKCMVSGPTFWTRKWLTTITTQVATAPGANTYRPVDSFELKHNFLDAQYDTNPPAWLDSLQRTGHAPDGALASLPPVTFHANAAAMPNRQTGPEDNRPPFLRLRVAKIFTETGGGIVVTYSEPDSACVPGVTKPAPENNTTRCFPVYWAPDGQDDPTKIEWFNKYVVTQVSEEDFVTGAPRVLTRYEYLGGAAWAKDDSEFAKPGHRTWSEWRGYAHVRTITGETDSNLRTAAGRKETRYFRGMHGDPLPKDPSGNNATRSVQVNDSTGAFVADDLLPYQGTAVEVITYLENAAAPVVAVREVSIPRAQETVSRARIDLPALTAYRLGLASIRKTESISDPLQQRIVPGGPTRTTESVTLSFDSASGRPHQVEDRGLIDPANPNNPDFAGDEQCTVSTYVNSTSANIIGAVAQVRTTTGSCADAATAGPERVVSDVQTFYDGHDDLRASPLKGQVSSTRMIDGAGSTHVQTAATEYDIYGRIKRLTDASGGVTKTTYTPADSSSATLVTVTNPLLHESSSTMEPGRGQVVSTADANGLIVRTAYDPLGRQTAVWKASQHQAGAAANVRHTYVVSADRATSVKTETLRDDGTYGVTTTLYDGLLRPRQTQTEAVGPGRLITDNLYNGSGGVRRNNTAYLAAGEPGTALYIPISSTEIRTWIESTYDGLGRVTRAELWYGGAQSPSRVTEKRYGGDQTTVIPPPGGTASRTWTDVHGRTTRIDQFTNAARTTYSSTTYAYDIRGDRIRATDPAGNIWKWKFDARGLMVESEDPDKGITTFSYDNGGRLIGSTDARGNTLATTYDAVGRKTTLRASDRYGPKLAEWFYDTAPGGIGQLAKSVRYDGADQYVNAVTGYDREYRPLGTAVTIPDSAGALKGTYTTTQTYTLTGKVAEVSLPSAGGLPTERVVTRYSSDGLPISTSGHSWYTSDVIYSPYGEVLRTQSGAAPTRLWTTATYDEHTGQILSSTTHREAGPYLVGETRYRYDKADNLTSINERTPGPNGGIVEDFQCFAFDTLRRMTEAWTSTNQCSTGPTTGPSGSVGGPDAYWTSYTFDALGNRLTEKSHAPNGDTAADSLRTYTYPPAPSGNKHQVSSVASSGQTPSTGSYTYDAAGNTRSRTINGREQQLLWDTEGRLERVSEDSDNTEYIYDADGNRLIGRTASSAGTVSTLSLGHTEVIAWSDGTITAERYYGHPGAPTAVRTSGPQGTLTFLITDHHGTATTAVGASAGMPVLRRKSMPFGQQRGQVPNVWPGTRGFVGGKTDTSTGLTHLGAREYDPGLGRFISVDPIIDITDPLQMQGYGYANNNPVSLSDPTGRSWFDSIVDSINEVASRAIDQSNNKQISMGMRNTPGTVDTPAGPKSVIYDGNGVPHKIATDGDNDHSRAAFAYLQEELKNSGRSLNAGNGYQLFYQEDAKPLVPKGYVRDANGNRVITGTTSDFILVEWRNGKIVNVLSMDATTTKPGTSVTHSAQTVTGKLPENSKHQAHAVVFVSADLNQARELHAHLGGDPRVRIIVPDGSFDSGSWASQFNGPENPRAKPPTKGGGAASGPVLRGPGRLNTLNGVGAGILWIDNVYKYGVVDGSVETFLNVVDPFCLVSCPKPREWA
ncbi:RHS repeat domain-containing protein [Streptodolium elevatio]|uniref:RHS repeat-associated core domain-containing protein n=1 Tax=Streptodolium elevatio TaxID=3157996 RepID=A0ABV3DGR8_9ACTN